ncbi:MAG: hypothetical protein ABW166_15960 [Sedimenticola sp.]
MSEIDQLILLAEYNQLMNKRQYAAAANLSKDQLCEDRGAFVPNTNIPVQHRYSQAGWRCASP